MVTVTTSITYDSGLDKYFVVGHATDSGSGKTAEWKVIEEILRRSNSLFGKTWNTIEEAVEEIKSHSAFRVKVRSCKKGVNLSGHFF